MAPRQTSTDDGLHVPVSIRSEAFLDVGRDRKHSKLRSYRRPVDPNRKIRFPVPAVLVIIMFGGLGLCLLVAGLCHLLIRRGQKKAAAQGKNDAVASSG